MKTCPKCRLRYPEETTFCFVDGSTLEAAEDGLQGATLGGLFVVGEPIGKSPWSSTYRGEHRLLRRSCVIKVLEQSLDEAGRATFAQSLALARRVRHPYVAAITSGGVGDDGLAFAVRDPVGGTPLTKLLDQAPLGVERSVRIALQLLQGLGRIHDFGVIHGDLRPSNVLVDTDDRVTIVDTGVGRTCHRPVWETAPGTLAAQLYLAPELPDELGVPSTEPPAAGGRGDAAIAADLYAVGTLVAEMLTGELLVEAADVADLRRQLGEPLPPGLGGALGDVPERLVAWVEALLQRDPSRRPSGAHEAIELLRPFCDAASIAIADSPTAAAPERPAMELPPIFARWGKYVPILERMVEVGFPSGPPSQTANALGTIRGRVADLEEVGKQATYHHEILSDVHGRAHEGRERIAEQMSALTEQANALRAELAPLTIAGERHGDSIRELVERARELHREIIRWEGRSGFVEPYAELAAAYRDMAEIVDRWASVRSAERSCQEQATTKQRSLDELEAELAELRSALRVLESNVAEELAASEQALAELGQRLDELEPELLELAARMTAPLRAKPELSTCFRELEQVAS